MDESFQEVYREILGVNASRENPYRAGLDSPAFALLKLSLIGGVHLLEAF